MPTAAPVIASSLMVCRVGASWENVPEPPDHAGATATGPGLTTRTGGHNSMWKAGCGGTRQRGPFENRRSPCRATAPTLRCTKGWDLRSASPAHSCQLHRLPGQHHWPPPLAAPKAKFFDPRSRSGSRPPAAHRTHRPAILAPRPGPSIRTSSPQTVAPDPLGADSSPSVLAPPAWRDIMVGRSRARSMTSRYGHPRVWTMSSAGPPDGTPFIRRRP
jgi:hypothetical protein